MPHVTFIHGIANKPAKETLLKNWNAELEVGGLNLAAKGITSSMVYWADVVYEKPLGTSTNFESVGEALGTDTVDEDLNWVNELPPEQRAFTNSLIEKLELTKTPPDGDNEATPAIPLTEDDDYNFEAIPLPWFIKRRVMKRLLKDAHHYLFNQTFSPRPQETYEVRTELRNRFINQLKADKEKCSGPHIVVGHSMGTVISYDCLKNVEGCPSIDGYMTVGSPLGISEVFDNFDPAYNYKNAFPSENILGEWVNVYDRLDPVAFDAQLSNDYQKAGLQIIKDQRVRNSGAWRHSSYKYYSQEALTEHLSRLLGL